MTHTSLKKTAIALIKGTPPQLIDGVMSGFVALSAIILGAIRQYGIQKLPLSRRILDRLGVFPIRNSYYEPQFKYAELDKVSLAPRNLPGIDWNMDGQLDFLSKLTYADELSDLSVPKGKLDFDIDNGSFASGDAEYWYQIIRSVKPRKIIEIGSGNSTLMALRALEKNRADDSSYACEHICVEPYEAPWLEQAGVKLIRNLVENVDSSIISDLDENDILFIDSSHIIRPRGDVLFEYLELLPSLKKGVIVHIHDIFSPRNYPARWLRDEVLFWNEQYLLEAFLTNNHDWEIIGALNFLSHDHFDKVKKVAPFLAKDRDPGSFYIRKIL